MHKQAQAVVLLLLGGSVLKASVTDLYLRYVKEGLRPFLIVAGALLVAAAVMTLVHDLWPSRRAAAPGDAAPGGAAPGDVAPGGASGDAAPGGVAPGGAEAAGHGHAHDHGPGGHHEPRVGWLLILPVLGLLLVSPPALGSYAAGQAGTALTAQQVSDYPPLPAGDPVRISLLDYASRAIFDKGASLGDRRVRLTGFIATEPNGEPILARIILSCCAADGRPIKLGMTGEAPAGLAADSWVEVVGRYTDRSAKDPVNGEEIPYVEVESWRQIDPPKQQYE
ncbi:TIGR03943 family protein [Micromonospora sp. NPDC049559]|uniref:TIGR03943 family putative permease subunit n=1 Tax=Micromonospora sp. NPDC049559 TaxID=3155923 RepID=UPI003441D380